MSSDKDVKVMLGDPKKAILSMIAPIMIAFLIGQLNLFVDSIWCSSLGPNVMSAIGLVMSIYFVFLGIGNGIGVGLNVCISRMIGAGDTEGAARRLSSTLIFMIIVSVPLTPIMLLFMDPIILLIGGGEIMDECRQYLLPVFVLLVSLVMNGLFAGALRGEGAAKMSSIMLGFSAVMNLILDPVMIFGFGLGLLGASIATMISSVIATAAFALHYLRGNSYIPLKLSEKKIDWESVRDVMNVGLPQMLELNVMSVLNLALVALVMGTGGPDGMTTYSIPWRIASLMIVVAQSFAAAMVPVCSSSIGQGDRERMRTGYYFAVKSATLYGTILSVIIAIAAPLIVLLFTYDPSMIGFRDELVRVTRIYCSFMVFFGLIYVGSSMLSALKKSQYALASSLIRNIVLIAMFVVSSYHDMDWFYWSLAIGEIFGGILMMALAQWFFRKQYAAMGPKADATA